MTEDTAAPVEGAQAVEGSDAPPAAPVWTETLPPELRGYAETKGFKDPASVLSSYQNLEKLRGVPEDRLLKLPQNADDPDAMGEVYNRLGRPESPDKYTNVLGEALTDDVYKSLAGEAHKAGVTDKQWQALQKTFAGQVEAVNKAREQAQVAELSEWGEKNPREIQGVRDLLNKAGADDAAIDEFFEASGMAGVRMLAKVASLGFERPVPQDAGGGGFTMSPQAARAKIAEKMSDKDFMTRYTHNNSKIRMPAIEEMERLQKIAVGAA